MTYDAIRLFILCAKYLSITKAAREAGIDRSAASRQLQQLQHELRSKLFHSRSGYGIEVTKAGWTFLKKVSPIMSQLYALEKSYTRRKESLTLAGSHGPSTHLLPSLMRRFNRSYPSAKLELRTASSPAVESWLLASDVDLAVISKRTTSPSLQIEPFRNEKLVAFVAPNHPLAQKKLVRTSEFGDIHLVVKIRRNGKSRTETQLSKFAEKGIQFKTILRCESSESVKAAVKQGECVGILFHDTVRAEIDQGEFIAVEFEGLNVDRQTYIAYSKVQPLSPYGQAFLALLRASATNAALIKPLTRQISNRQQNGHAPDQIPKHLCQANPD